jgi:parallel beta-helix repeat protein
MDAGAGSARLVEAGTRSWRSILLRLAAFGLATPVVATLALAARADAFVYWANLNTHTIGRANLDGSSVNPGFITGARSPIGVAVDELAPPPPKCGDTITTDTTLHRDLVNCPNNGIIIGADGITLDLNGHTIHGDAAPFSGCHPRTEVCDVGVVNDGHDRVTVTHGSVSGFDGGVGMGGNRNRYLDLSASRNRFYGLGLFGSAKNLVRNSSATGAFGHEGDGVILFGSHDVRILHNSFRNNVHAGIVSPKSNHNLIKGNSFSKNDDEGLLIEGGKGNQVRGNRFSGNGGGITLGPGIRNVISRNRVSGGRDGIRIEQGHGNLVANNVVVDARRAGIRLGIPHPFLGGADNVVRGNLVKDSRVDGYLVNAKDDHSLLRHNTARRAGDDGFDVESRSAKLTKNLALRNGDLGIAAVRGVTDGGGNVARHNGDPRQCTHIVCR